MVTVPNPYSESHFKTLKYRPNFPERFGCAEDAHGFSADFFRWYNDERHHTGLGPLTPADVHFSLAEQRHTDRTQVLAAAHGLHPTASCAEAQSRQPYPLAALSEIGKAGITGTMNFTNTSNHIVEMTPGLTDLSTVTLISQVRAKSTVP